MSKIRNREQNNNKKGCPVCVECKLSFPSKWHFQVGLLSEIHGP